MNRQYKRGNSAKNNIVVDPITDQKLPKVEGLKFGLLTVLEAVGLNTFKKVVWKCECRCGEIAFRTLSALKKGTENTSCGCYDRNRLILFREERSKSVDIEKIGPKIIYKNYKNNAKYKKRKFDLQLKDFSVLIKGNCFYCNSAPSNECLIYNRIVFKYNGIDRININYGMN